MEDKQEISKFDGKKILLITLIVILICVLIALIVLFIIYGIVPCSYKKCHPNAYCINYPFFADCVCKYGYNGNGVEYCDECGLNFFEHNARIVGGKEAVPHSWPSTVLIFISYKTIANLDNDTVFVETGFMCGGSLINRRTVLTAAHCILTEFDYFYNDKFYKINITENIFHPTIESIYKVFLGADLYITSNININPTLALNVEYILKHNAYDPNNVLNDIAILKLSKTVNLDKYVQLACLPNPNLVFYPLPNVPGIAVGWGVLTEGGKLPEKLHNVQITIYNETMCDNISNYTFKNWPSQICAGEYQGGKDTCQGDSGGPLFSYDMINGKEKYILVGITSYGEGCAQQYLPGIYTRVSYFSNWIHQNSKF